MTLEQLRGHFQGDQIAFKEMQDKALRKKEEDLVAEIEQLKREKKEQRLHREKEQEEMANIVDLVKRTKEVQYKGIVEREDISAALERAQKEKGSQSKVIELTRLMEEREGLRLREDDLINEISEFEKTSKQKEEEIRVEKEQNKSLRKDGKDFLKREDILRREKEYRKEKAGKIAELK